MPGQGLPAAAQGIVRRIPLIDRLVNGAADISLDPQGGMKNLPVLAGSQAAAYERSFYTGVFDVTRNTGVNLTVATGTTYATTQALLIVANTAPAGSNAPDVIMDSLVIKQTAVNTGGTFWYWYHAIDRGNRGPAAGTGVATLLNMQNSEGYSPPGVQVYAGVVTAAAVTSDVRDVGFNVVQNGVGVANAMFILKYGRLENPVSGTFTIPTTGVAITTYDAPPIVIPPGSSYILNEFQTARSATATGEVAVSIIVR